MCDYYAIILSYENKKKTFIENNKSNAEKFIDVNTLIKKYPHYHISNPDSKILNGVEYQAVGEFIVDIKKAFEKTLEAYSDLLFKDEVAYIRVAIQTIGLFRIPINIIFEKQFNELNNKKREYQDDFSNLNNIIAVSNLDNQLLEIEDVLLKEVTTNLKQYQDYEAIMIVLVLLQEVDDLMKELKKYVKNEPEEGIILALDKLNGDV